jgi:hypothetical protein
MLRVLSGAVAALIVGSALAMLPQAGAQQPVAMRMAAPELAVSACSGFVAALLQLESS